MLFFITFFSNKLLIFRKYSNYQTMQKPTLGTGINKPSTIKTTNTTTKPLTKPMSMPKPGVKIVHK